MNRLKSIFVAVLLMIFVSGCGFLMDTEEHCQGNQDPNPPTSNQFEVGAPNWGDEGYVK